MTNPGFKARLSVNQKLVGFSLNCVSIISEGHSHLLETSMDKEALNLEVLRF